MYKRNKIFFIAEAGVNHDGELKKAFKLVDIAKWAGADAIKFQTWKTENLIVKKTKMAPYQKKNLNLNNDQYSMLKKYELSYDQFIKLVNYCRKKKILFLSTPDEIESAFFLKKYQNIFKIGSGELTNYQLLKIIGSFRKKVILSTGMGTVTDIKKAISILIKSGTKKKNISILHCNSSYPTPIRDANLQSIKYIEKILKINTGYSDHTIGTDASIGAAYLGAKIIEKHFTYNKKAVGPDHKVSLEPDELKFLIQKIRIAEKMLGNFSKKISSSEKVNIKYVRKSFFAKKNIKKDEKFSDNNLILLRPQSGIKSTKYYKLIKKKSKKEYIKGQKISIDELK